MDVLAEIADGVATLTLNAPARHNALTEALAEELIGWCDRIDADSSVGAVVVRGAGASFCSGADRGLLADVGRDPGSPDNVRRLALIYESFVRVGAMQTPTIAAVRGHAIGAGLNLMLAADLRIVAESARLAAGFVRLGIHPGGGHFALLARSGGRQAAAAIGLFGEQIDGRRAAEIGLAWRAVPDDEVEPAAALLATHAAQDPELVRAAVASLRREVGPPPLSWPEALELEKAAQLWSMGRARRAGNPDDSVG